MAQTEEIYEQEKKRVVPQDYRTAWLYREGTFLRAYEWSAWLFVKFVHKFNATKRINKSIGQPLVMIGFPVTSMEKFTPEGGQVTAEADGGITVIFLQSAIPDDAGMDALLAEYAKWKDEIPVSETKPAKCRKISTRLSGRPPRSPG